MKYLLILTTLILFGCTNNSSMQLPLVSSIFTLPQPASAQYLAWHTSGDLLWLDQDLQLIKHKKLDFYSLQRIEKLNDGLLLLVEVNKNNEIVDEFIKLSFSGEQLTHWTALPDSVNSITTEGNKVSFLGFMGDKYQLSENSIDATGNNYGKQASIITLNSNEQIICRGSDSTHAPKCSKSGTQSWTKEGLWGASPKLCANYLVEDSFHKAGSNFDNWQVAIRDTKTGNIIGEIDLPELTNTQCIDDQLITIGQTINVYQLPQLQPISVTTCAGEKAQDATVSATDIICINTAGKLISQRLQ